MYCFRRSCITTYDCRLTLALGELTDGVVRDVATDVVPSASGAASTVQSRTVLAPAAVVWLSVIPMDVRYIASCLGRFPVPFVPLIHALNVDSAQVVI